MPGFGLILGKGVRSNSVLEDDRNAVFDDLQCLKRSEIGCNNIKADFHLSCCAGPDSDWYSLFWTIYTLSIHFVSRARLPQKEGLEFIVVLLSLLLLLPLLPLLLLLLVLLRKRVFDSAFLFTSGFLEGGRLA